LQFNDIIRHRAGFSDKFLGGRIVMWDSEQIFASRCETQAEFVQYLFGEAILFPKEAE